MTGTSGAQLFLDKYGVLMGIVGVALALVFGALWVSERGNSVPPVDSNEPVVAATLPALPAGGSSTTVTTPENPDVTTTPVFTEPNGSFVAVKIDNAPRAVPQVGLGLAEILIEMPVEGGLTRFTAFYEAGADLPVVGPVRSLRWTDVSLLPLFTDSVLSTGGRDFIAGALESGGVRIYDFGSGLLIRSDAAPPHNVSGFAGSVPIGTPTTPFAPGRAPSGGERPGIIGIAYSSLEMVEWRWEDGGFTRYSNGSVHKVLETEDGPLVNLSRDSVLVLMVPQRSAGYTDVAGAEVPIFDLIGTGAALLATEDGLVEGVWVRLSLDDPLTILDDQGEPVSVPMDGLGIAIVPTFVEVVLD